MDSLHRRGTLAARHILDASGGSVEAFAGVVKRLGAAERSAALAVVARLHDALRGATTFYDLPEAVVGGLCAYLRPPDVARFESACAAMRSDAVRRAAWAACGISRRGAARAATAAKRVAAWSPTHTYVDGGPGTAACSRPAPAGTVVALTETLAFVAQDTSLLVCKRGSQWALSSHATECRVWEMRLGPARGRDGAQLAVTATEDGSVQLWQLRGEEFSFVRDLPPSAHGVFAFDGRRLAMPSGSDPTSVSVWDVEGVGELSTTVGSLQFGNRPLHCAESLHFHGGYVSSIFGAEAASIGFLLVLRLSDSECMGEFISDTGFSCGGHFDNGGIVHSRKGTGVVEHTRLEKGCPIAGQPIQRYGWSRPDTNRVVDDCRVAGRSVVAGANLGQRGACFAVWHRATSERVGTFFPGHAEMGLRLVCGSDRGLECLYVGRGRVLDFTTDVASIPEEVATAKPPRVMIVLGPDGVDRVTSRFEPGEAVSTSGRAPPGGAVPERVTQGSWSWLPLGAVMA